MTAYARNPAKLDHFKNERFSVIKGELEDHDAIEKACHGQDAVFIALGGKGIMGPDTTCSVGTRAIIGGMKKTGVSRMFVCSSWGVGEGNREKVNWFIRWMLTYPLADKDIQEADIQKSGLTYSIFRPPQLVDEPARGNLYHCLDQNLRIQKIARADVAAFMLQAARDNTFINQTPAVSWSA